LFYSFIREYHTNVSKFITVYIINDIKLYISQNIFNQFCNWNINGEELKHVYIYPTPENIDKIIYKDKANNCFMYQPTEVECPNNINLVSTIPTQL